LRPALALEGRPPNKQLVGKHPDAPQIDCAVVGLPFDDFWRGIVESAAEGGPHVLHHGRPAEIAHLRNAVGEDDVFGLDVAVGDGIFVQVYQCVDDVPQEVDGVFARQGADLVLVVEESASIDVLEDQVEGVFFL